MLPWRGRAETITRTESLAVECPSPFTDKDADARQAQSTAAYGRIADKLVQLTTALWSVCFKFLVFPPSSLKNTKD